VNPSDDQPPSLSVVVVAYGPEDWLERSVDAVLASEGVTVEVIVVDNGGTAQMVDHVATKPGVRMIRPGSNTGFARGTNLGAAEATGEFLALVNPDAIVDPTALAELVSVAAEPGVGIATACVELADRPDLLNSAGNAIHFLGVSWAGSFEEPVADHRERRTATAASGAAMVIRREWWEHLGGLCEPFFAYYEDADLSLRSWQQGRSVEYVPTAEVLHRYEFSRNAIKFRLLERNRLAMALSSFSTRHLVLTLPLLLGLELGIVAYAAKEGWLREKLASYRWVWRRRAWLRRRRADLAASRLRSERELAHLYSANLDPKNIGLPDFVQPIDKVMAAYWRLVRRVI
jgi:GT2 family glycosyltransferase